MFIRLPEYFSLRSSCAVFCINTNYSSFRMLMCYPKISRVLRDRILTREMVVSRQENEYHRKILVKILYYIFCAIFTINKMGHSRKININVESAHQMLAINSSCHTHGYFNQLLF